MKSCWQLLAATLIAGFWLASGDCFAAAPIARVLPPPGVDLPSGKKAELVDELTALKKRFETAPQHPLRADVETYIKAVDFALRYGEFYNEKDVTKDVAKAVTAMKVANERLDQLAHGKTPWTEQRGTFVRGYYSSIDGSPQPYGLVVPEKLDLTKPVPLYVWLHGRGDKQTDLHFIIDRQGKPGEVAPTNAIVLHAFGRQCIGFKSAGEIDILEAIEHAKTQYKIDPKRIVLMGFSMGGAGAWHVGAHYADHWVAVSPGAGFAETAQYNKVKVDDTPWYEQTLWGCYDVPAYTRNLFNVPTFAYSGEKDKQIQAARIMEAAFQSEGRKLTHLIGPNVEHKYQPDTLKELLKQIDQAVAQGLDTAPAQVSLQTRTLRYNRVHWVEALGLEEHWKDARIDAEMIAVSNSVNTCAVKTKNISSLRLTPPAKKGILKLTIDGQEFTKQSPNDTFQLEKTDDKWIETIGRASRSTSSTLTKRPGQQGPIDDAFLEPFLVVVPTGKSKRKDVHAWVLAELTHFQERWRTVFRGEPRIKRDTEITSEDLEKYHLILWGDPDSNALIRKVQGQLPVNWPNGSVQIEDQRFSGESHVPVLIYPNPLNREKYVVLNSGPTFREAHDKTNSQQNPKLPDWAIIDITTEPSASSPGRIAAAGFFDERWHVEKIRKP